MHEVASLPKSAFVLLVKDLAPTSAVQLTIPIKGVLRPQFVNPMGELAPVVIGTISLLHKVLAELDLDIVPFGDGELPIILIVVALAGLKGVTLL